MLSVSLCDLAERERQRRGESADRRKWGIKVGFRPKTIPAGNAHIFDLNNRRVMLT